MLRPTNTGAETSTLLEIEKGRHFFSLSGPTKRRPNLCDSFFEKMLLPVKENAAQKGRRLNASARKGKTPGSNRGRRFETAICIYALKEEIRA